MLNFILIGCGKISSNHIKALAANKQEATLVAVCDPIAKLAEAAAKNYHELTGIMPTVYTNSKKAMAHPETDCAAIATGSGFHKELADMALEHGCHVLIEKPIALGTQDAREICDIARKKNLTVGICNQNRFNPVIQQLRRAVEAGRFGKITHATARILWNRNTAYYEQAPWRGTWKMDGGVLMNQCIHNIDLLQWMLGGEAESIMAMTRRAMRPIEAEDFGAALVRFKSGAIGIIEGTACVYPKNLEESLSFFGEKGTVVIGGAAFNNIKTWEFEEVHPQDDEIAAIAEKGLTNSQSSGHTPLYADFIKAVNTGGKPLIDGQEGMKSLQLILGAYKSQKDGQSIEIQDLDFSTEQMQGTFA